MSDRKSILFGITCLFSFSQSFSNASTVSMAGNLGTLLNLIPHHDEYRRCFNSTKYTVIREKDFALGMSENFVRWPEGVIYWNYNPENEPSGVATDTYVGWIKTALAYWEAVSGVEFVYKGTSRKARVDDDEDGVVTIGWSKGDNDYSGRGGPVWTSGVTDYGYRPAVDGSILLSAEEFSLGDEYQTVLELKQELIETLVHEAGHVMGLGHSDDPASIMFANPYNDVNRLSEDDIRVANDLYGTSPSVNRESLDDFSPQGDSRVIDFDLMDRDWNPIKKVQSSVDTPIFVKIAHSQKFDEPFELIVADQSGWISKVITTSLPNDQTSCNSQSCTSPLYLTSSRFLAGKNSRKKVVLAANRHLVASRDIVVSGNLQENLLPEFELITSKYRIARGGSVTLSLRYGADPEGDILYATWHIPEHGEVRHRLDSDGGILTEDVMFDSSGNHEIFVSISDNVRRYRDSGEGFRRAFSTIIFVR